MIDRTSAFLRPAMTHDYAGARRGSASELALHVPRPKKFSAQKGIFYNTNVNIQLDVFGAYVDKTRS